MTDQDIINGIGIGNGTEQELSAYVLKLEQGGQLEAICARFEWKPGRRKDYRKAALEGLRQIASVFALMN